MGLPGEGHSVNIAALDVLDQISFMHIWSKLEACDLKTVENDSLLCSV